MCFLLLYTFTVRLKFTYYIQKSCEVLTLPRLEFMAAATLLAKFGQSSISPDNKSIAVHLWTDSQIVLQWLLNKIHSQSFVHQCINKILQHFPTQTGHLLPQQIIQQTFLLGRYLPVSCSLPSSGHMDPISYLIQKIGSGHQQMLLKSKQWKTQHLYLLPGKQHH